MMALISLPPLPSGASLSMQAPGLKMGLGGRLWPSAATMCRWLCNENLSDACVLELGCGCGGVGLYSAALGARHVVLTDGGSDELLQTAAGNAGRNHRLLSTSIVEVKSHCWGERDFQLPPRLDYVLASDVSYSIESHDALCRSIRWLLEERSPLRVVLAHEHRCLTSNGYAALSGLEGDDALAHLFESAAAVGLQMTTVCTESQDEAGTVTAREDGTVVEEAPVGTGTAPLEWTDLLLERGRAVSLLELTLR